MKKINNYLILYTVLIVLFILGSLFLFTKSFPLFLSDAVIRCKTILHSFKTMIPSEVLVAFFAFVGVVTLISIIRFIFSFSRIRRLKRKQLIGSSIPVSLRGVIRKLHLKEAVYVVESNKPYAFCFGLLHPKIYLSTRLVSLVDGKELEAILRHEEFHLRNRDTLTRFMAYLTQSLFPFFPVLADLTRNCTVEQEIQADMEAIKGLGDDKHLVRVLRKLLKYNSHALCPVPAFNIQNTLEVRISALIKKKAYSKKPSFIRTLISVFSLLVIGGFLVIPTSAKLRDSDAGDIYHCGKGYMCTVKCITQNNIPFSTLSRVNSSSLPQK